MSGQHGFGLIEQIMTLVLLAVLAAMAVPAFHRMLEGHELRVAQTDYIVALQHARNLAVNEQTRVIFCPSQDALTCSGSKSWGNGWLIGLVDSKKKTQMAGPPRYTGRGYRDALTVASNSSRNYVWFGPDGSSVGTEQSFFFCVKDDPQRILSVVISKVGRVRGESLQDTNKFQCPTTN
ncbi:GspH/FimT family pseudopilin [Dyella sp. 2HG41-7]|uniref:GspH/FimT family pseudopilin n=1 Tax=Dyella sp. 2HG41-7 TaxID=2883239 RepID=UPI001F48D20E|nr:GspH/FimT family pseudopilin [Dyella sp. 2HG41-7]